MLNNLIDKTKNMNIILFGLALLSLILIIIIELDMGFIPSNQYEALNSIAVILSSGYFGSYIVYFLTMIIPEWNDKKRTLNARKKTYAVSTSYVTCHIIANIRGGIIRSNNATVDELCDYLTKNPLYERCVNARNGESLCESIWQLYQIFRDSFMEYCILYDKYHDSESLELIAAIKDCAFYRCLNEQFSLYNTKPIIQPDGTKVFRDVVLGKVCIIKEHDYDCVVRTLMSNLIELVDLVNELKNKIV